MQDITTYLVDQGSKSFSQSPFTSVDNVCISLLAYLDFSGIVPAPKAHGQLGLQDAFQRYIQLGRIGSCQNEELVAKMASSRRYAHAQLSGFRVVFDKEKMEQFAAICVRTDDDVVYIAFRGTDNSLIGWREDFAMSYGIVASQVEAVSYLRSVMRRDGTQYRIGGHSKGGSLAEFAAMMCVNEWEESIIAIYSNDGPGICPEMDFAKRHTRIRAKLIRVVPSFSIFGMLFNHEAANEIVCSSANGVMQHDAMTWKVIGDEFVQAPVLAEKSSFYIEIIGRWIAMSDMEQRRLFVRDLFDAFEKCGIHTFDRLCRMTASEGVRIMFAMATSNRKTKDFLWKLVYCVTRQLRFAQRRGAQAAAS